VGSIAQRWKSSDWPCEIGRKKVLTSTRLLHDAHDAIEKGTRMFTNALRHFVMIVCLVCCVSSANAAPVSYAFSGTLDQPYNGSSQFSGTFTYDTDLPLYPGITPFPGWSYYSGVPADPTEPVLSLTFKLGNTASSSFGNIVQDELVVAHTQSNDAFYINETFSYTGGQNLTANIGMVNNNLVYRGPFNSTAPPSSLSLTSFSMGAQLILQGTTAGGQYESVVGTITSLTPLTGGGGPPSVPEPASVLVFLVMGAGFAVHLRTSASRRNT